MLTAVTLRASWIEAKAGVAQVLIAKAWQQTLQSGPGQRPWPWADTWPVLRLQTPGGKAVYILESGSGEALAFGPGRLRTAEVEQSGLMIAGHRDTHFEFLEAIRVGDRMALQQHDGSVSTYRVSHTRVVDSRTATLRPPAQASRLLLISCYPFDAARAGGPLRYLVYADRIGAESTI